MHAQLKKFAMFQQNYMIVLEMANNLGVSLLLICVFFFCFFLLLLLLFLFVCFYAPNFGEVEGAYWFGPVRPSFCPSVRP